MIMTPKPMTVNERLSINIRFDFSVLRCKFYGLFSPNIT